jgi:hypothetical protein
MLPGAASGGDGTLKMLSDVDDNLIPYTLSLIKRVKNMYLRTSARHGDLG